METVEGNKLIAIFDGWEIVPMVIKPSLWIEKFYNGSNHSVNIIDINGRVVDTSNNLKYHSSWDWLMPVWVKISTMIAPVEEKGITVHDIRLVSDKLFQARINYRTVFSGTNSQHKWFEFIDADPLRATWCVIIQFITWYNNTKK